MMLKATTVWTFIGIMAVERYHATGYEINSRICGKRKVTPDVGRIVGGSRSDPGSWPWQAMMQSNGISICGAVLISEEYLLTAAHCVLSGRKDLTFHLGAHRADASDETAVEVQVHVMICHPDFEWQNYPYDLCVVKLATPTNFTDFIQPVCLPEQESRVAVGERVMVTGWGITQNTGSNEYLNEAEVFVLDTSTCKSWYESLGLGLTVPDSHFCAGHEEGQIDSCEGDSGGPLVHSENFGNTTAYVLRGITSFGYRCALPERPGVYVTVSKLLTWIYQKMTELSAPICQATASAVCGGYITSEIVIRSPTSAGTFDYPPNQACRWNITAPEGFQIQFTFSCYFLLSPPDTEGEDYVEITDSGGNQRRFVGNEIPSPYIVDAGNASLTFVTNHELSYPGFVAKIAFVKLNASTTVNTPTSSPVVTSQVGSTGNTVDITTTIAPAAEATTTEIAIGIGTTAFHDTTSASDSATNIIGSTTEDASSMPTTNPQNDFNATKDRTHGSSVTTKNDDTTLSTSYTHHTTGNDAHTDTTVITTSRAASLHTVNWAFCVAFLLVMRVCF